MPGMRHHRGKLAIGLQQCFSRHQHRLPVGFAGGRRRDLGRLPGKRTTPRLPFENDALRVDEEGQAVKPRK